MMKNLLSVVASLFTSVGLCVYTWKLIDLHWSRSIAMPSYEVNYNLERIAKTDFNTFGMTYLNEPICGIKNSFLVR